MHSVILHSWAGRTDDVFDNHGPSFAVYFEKLSTTYVEIISETSVYISPNQPWSH